MTEEYTPEELAMFSAEEQAEVTGSEAVEAEAQEAPAEQSEIDDSEPVELQEPQAEAAPEAPAAAPEQPQRPPEGFVPHQAMAQERAKRQELEKRLAELEGRIPKQEAEQPPAYIDPIVDPDGYRKWAEFQANSSHQVVQQLQEQQQAQQKAAERQMQVQNYVQQFTQQQPDYMDAVNHLVQKRQADLMAQGYGQAEMMQAIQAEADQIFDAGVAAGMNPAHLIYLRAQQEGYAMATPAPAAQPQATPVPQQAPAAPSAQAQQAAQQLTAQARAQAQTQGLAGTGGAPQQGKLTLKQLAAMNEAEFNKAQREDPEGVMRAMNG